MLGWRWVFRKIETSGYALRCDHLEDRKIEARLPKQPKPTWLVRRCCESVCQCGTLGGELRCTGTLRARGSTGPKAIDSFIVAARRQRICARDTDASCAQKRNESFRVRKLAGTIEIKEFFGVVHERRSERLRKQLTNRYGQRRWAMGSECDVRGCS